VAPAATVTSAVPLVEPSPQCEVAFPGNRIFSPSPTDEVRVVLIEVVIVIVMVLMYY